MIIPKQNEADINDVPESVRNELDFVTADFIDTVLQTALCVNNQPKKYSYVESSQLKDGEATIKQ